MDPVEPAGPEEGTGGPDGGVVESVEPSDPGGTTDAGQSVTDDRAPDAGARDGGSRANPLRVVTRFSEGCEHTLMPVAGAPGRYRFTDFSLEDTRGTNETLRTHCALVHEFTIARGHRLVAGEVTARGQVALTASGRGTLSLRVALAGEAVEPQLAAYGDEAYEGPAVIAMETPTLDACAGAIDATLETLVSLTLRADRDNRSPRRIEVDSIEFPEWAVVPCAGE